MNARHTMSTAECYTPSHVAALVREALGGYIELDPASTPKANKLVKADTIFTKEQDGLQQDWRPFKTVYLNPPGGRNGLGPLVPQFWKKFCAEVSHGIWMGYSLEQLQSLQKPGLSHPFFVGDAYCIPKTRIAFVREDGAKSPSHANYLVYRGRHSYRFEKLFAELGVTWHM